MYQQYTNIHTTQRYIQMNTPPIHKPYAQRQSTLTHVHKNTNMQTDQVGSHYKTTYNTYTSTTGTWFSYKITKCLKTDPPNIIKIYQ